MSQDEEFAKLEIPFRTYKDNIPDRSESLIKP